MSIAEIDNLEVCFASLDQLFGSLTDDQWATESLCPGWDARAVGTHLASVEYMLSGEPPGSFTESLPFEKVGDYTDSVEDLPNAAWLTAYRGTIASRRAELETYTAEAIDVASMTPVGPKTYRRFMAIRVFDFWIHEQDIRVPLDIPGHQDGPAAIMALNEIELSLGYIVGKKIGLDDEMSITFSLNGPVEREFHALVQGRAGQVDKLDGPADVVLSSDSTTFALLACGRIDPQVAIDSGKISWSGNDEWGERAARNLAFTM